MPALLAVEDEALTRFVRRDLLGEKVRPAPKTVWVMPTVERLLRKQLRDGSWPYPGKRVDCYPEWHYPLLETWKQFRVLVQQFEMTRRHPSCALAAEFLFSCQTGDGDFRGFLANQYATYYTGAILGLLSLAGYARDPRVERGMEWLVAMRQDDGGWTVPIQTHHLSRDETYRLTSRKADPLEPDRTQPFAHNATGMVLRAFAAHPAWRRHRIAAHAGTLLASRLFAKDVYASYRAASYWVRFQFPFWWNDLVAALDTLGRLGLPGDHPDVVRGLDWLAEHQRPDGLWDVTYQPGKRSQTKSDTVKRAWITLAICRLLDRF